MNKIVIITLCLLSAVATVAGQNNKNMKTRNIELTQDWDKTFPKSEKVDHQKVTFVNRYGITLAADLYIPKNADGKLPAIVVCGPYGAVKEQCSGLYAQEMAARGFLTMAFDPSYCGESGGEPRYVSSPDINTEDYSAAIDYLMLRDDVDEEKIGIIKRLRGDNKELMIIPGASHTDLYDQIGIIPFDKMEEFFRTNL